MAIGSEENESAGTTQRVQMTISEGVLDRPRRLLDVSLLPAAGFRAVSHRVGLHPGTVGQPVNFQMWSSVDEQGYRVSFWSGILSPLPAFETSRHRLLFTLIR